VRAVPTYSLPAALKAASRVVAAWRVCFRVLLSGVSPEAFVLAVERVDLRDRAGRCGGAEGQSREKDLGMHLDDRSQLWKAQVSLTMCVPSNQYAERRVVVIYIQPIPRSTSVPPCHRHTRPLSLRYDISLKNQDVGN
jgi:hypothetical protein